MTGFGWAGSLGCYQETRGASSEMRGFFAPLRMTSNNGKSNSNGKSNGNGKSKSNSKSNRGMLFGSQGLHGVDCGGVAGWKKAGEDSDSNECQDGCADDNGVVGTYFEEHAS